MPALAPASIGAIHRNDTSRAKAGWSVQVAQSCGWNRVIHWSRVGLFLKGSSQSCPCHLPS
eukprot:scaffold48271_cov30-Tisochrysis_lutea.AAC.2